MNNFISTVSEDRIVATQWRQLCNRLLHDSILVRGREVGWQ